MSDKQLIKHLEQIIKAQQQVIESWELLNAVQTKPPYTISGGGIGDGNL